MKNILFVIVAVVFLSASTCENTEAEFMNIRGFIFGSTYSIIYESSKKITPDSLKKDYYSLQDDFMEFFPQLIDYVEKEFGIQLSHRITIPF